MSAQKKIPGVVLVAVQLPKETDEHVRESLDELERLVTTLGYRVVATLTQSRSSAKGPTVIGEGKLGELARLTGGSGEVGQGFTRRTNKASENFVHGKNKPKGKAKPESSTPKSVAQIVVFDSDLSPSQTRNLESATGAQVLDRTGVIIEIFNCHAKTRSAKLQIEIARLNYRGPRLRETGGGEDRAAGGIGAKGIGESKVEIDKRRIRDRIKELKSEIASIQVEESQRRLRRKEENSVALVGYTNAGKSSLMRALTGSQVLVADQLFATLDTTVRPLFPDSKPKILISDTVGFIKKLPHDLVASFRSTLDEALNASLLLYIVDAADPTFRSQLEVTRKVLEEVGVKDIPSWVLLNKIDKLSAEEVSKLKTEFPDALFISALDKKCIAGLRLDLITFFEKEMVDEDIFIKYDSGGIIGEIRSAMRVLKENYENGGINLTVRSTHQELARFKKRFGI